MKRSFVAMFALLALVVAAPAFSGDKSKAAAPKAPPAPKTIASYRHTVMEGMAKHSGAIRMVVSGEVDRKQDLVLHAEALAAIAPTVVSLFPEGSGPDTLQTHAKVEIWTQRAEFEAAGKKFEEASAMLVEVAKGGDFDAFKLQYAAVGKSCGGCHDRFKHEDD